MSFNFFAADVIANPVSEMGSKMLDTILSSIVFFSLGIVLVAAVVGSMYYFFIYKRKFDIEVKINSERSGEKYNIIFDKAAIMTDSTTKSKYLRIWGMKVDLPLPNFNIIQQTSRGDFIEIHREGEGKFSYCSPAVMTKGSIIGKDGKMYSVTDQETFPIDSDMDYWNVKRKQQNKKMFDTESLMMKIIPFIPVIVGSIMMVFILFVLLDKIPEVLNELTTLTEAIQDLKMGTPVTPVFNGP